MSKQLETLRKTLRTLASTTRAESSKRFFKTGKGEYAEGDRFYGITVPEIRKLAKTPLTLTDLIALLRSKIHEERLLALIALADRYKEADPKTKQNLHDLYIAHTKFVNNWDLVDTSAETLVGAHVFSRSPALLKRLAKSENLWERRIAMIATFYHIKQGNAATPTAIATLLLNDKHDLIQKAVGWMLREIGKRVSKSALTDFLDLHAKTMPRTALRYAIEHFSKTERALYMKK